MPNKNKKLVLVTGGAGFIGGHLTDELIRQGFRVRVLDNLAPPSHNGRLPEWFNKKAEFIKGDVRNKKDLIRALRDVSFVFHLAAYMDFHWDFSAYFAINTLSTALLYEVISEKKYPVKKIIIASSQSVYGEGKFRCIRHGIVYPKPRDERQLKKHDWEMRCPRDGRILKPMACREDDLLVPTIPYGVSKWALEKAALNLGRICDIPSVLLRYTIVHGPRQSFRHFYSGALRQLAVMALAGDDLALHEDGNQIRDYVHVKDVVDAHIKVLRDARANFQIFNVGSGRSTRIKELARTIKKVLRIPAPVRTPGFYRLGAPRHSIADISKLKKLGWRPRHTIEDNVRDYAEWIKNYPEAKSYLARTLRKMKNSRLLTI